MAAAIFVAARGFAQEPPDAPAPPTSSEPAPDEPAPPADPDTPGGLVGSVEPAADPALPEEPVLPPAFDEGWAWYRVGPVGGGAMSDVVIHPADPNLYAVATLSGQVWLSIDAGDNWVSVLEPIASSLGEISPEEKVLLEVESRLDELMGDLEVDELTDEVDPNDYTDPEELEEALQELQSRTDDLADQAEEAARIAADEVQTELRSQPWFLEQQGVLSGRADAARPRVWFAPDGSLVVGRADGLWRSDNLGATWTQLLKDISVTSLVVDGGRWIAGTTEGLRTSSGELSSWDDRDENLGDLRVLDLARDGDVLIAATEAGLWTREPGARWSRVPGLDAAVLSLLVDPGWEGGLWLSTERTVLRSDDRGEHTRAPLGAPIPEVRSMVWLDRSRILVAGSDGVWESFDGGSTWSAVSRGLGDPDTRGLAHAGAKVLLTSDEGVFLLRPIIEEPTPADGGEGIEGELGDFVPVHLLLDAATGRPELVTKLGSRWGATLMPRITLEGRYRPEDQLLYDPDTGTTRQLSGEVQLLAQLQWTPAGRQSSTVTVNLRPDNLDDITVLDGTAQMVAASSVSRSATEYRSRLAGIVSELHTARAELVGAWPQVRQTSVLEQVKHDLRIQELEAQLDVLTDGAVSRWRLGGG